MSLRAVLLAFLLLCAAIAAAQSSQPPAIAALRASQDRSAAALRDHAHELRTASTDPLERAWAALALAEFENDLENADAALLLLDDVEAEAERLAQPELLFAALSRRGTILVNRGLTAETAPVLERMDRIAADAGHPAWRAEALHDRGVYERKLGRFDRALDQFQQALELQRRLDNRLGAARELNSIAMLHGRTGRFSDAVLAHNEALAIARGLDNRAEIARSLRLLGVLYRNLDDEELGARYLREALDHVEERNRREAIALNGELAMALIILGRLDEAAVHAQRAVSQAEQSGSPPNKVNAFTRMAELKLRQGDLPQASQLADRAFEQFDAVAIRDQILLRLTRARTWAAQRRTADALTEAEIALADARGIGDRILERNALDLLADQQLGVGDAASAFVTRKAHQALDKELAMDMAARRIAVLEASLGRERQDAERELLARDNQIQSLTLNRQRWIGIALVVGLAGVIAAAAALAARYRAIARNAAKLSASRDELARAHQVLVEQSSELERIADTDALTGLYNRRAITRELEQRCRDADAHPRPLCVLLLDLDLFKRINDEHGHQGGDAVLVEAAQRLRQALPQPAAIGRWGGEEFIAVLDDCGLARALTCAEDVRAAFANAAVIFEGTAIPLSTSIGIAERRDRSTTSGMLVRTADQALYRAKQKGRNRVEA